MPRVEDRCRQTLALAPRRVSGGSYDAEHAMCIIDQCIMNERQVSGLPRVRGMASIVSQTDYQDINQIVAGITASV